MDDYVLITKRAKLKGRLASHFIDNVLVQQYAELIIGDVPMWITKMGRCGGTYVHRCVEHMFDEWLESGGLQVYDERSKLVSMWRCRIKGVKGEC